MKREFLQNLLKDVDETARKTIIDSIMAENGADIENAKKPYSDYEDIKGQLKTANDTIETMKKNGDDVEKLKKTIKDHENTIEIMKKDAETKAKTSSLIEALKGEKLIDPEYFIFKQGGVDKFTFGQDGKPIGVSDMVKPFKESNKNWFQEEQKPGFKQIGGGSPGSNEPQVEDMDAALASAFGIQSN